MTHYWLVLTFQDDWSKTWSEKNGLTPKLALEYNVMQWISSWTLPRSLLGCSQVLTALQFKLIIDSAEIMKNMSSIYKPTPKPILSYAIQVSKTCRLAGLQLRLAIRIIAESAERTRAVNYSRSANISLPEFHFRRRSFKVVARYHLLNKGQRQRTLEGSRISTLPAPSAEDNFHPAFYHLMARRVWPRRLATQPSLELLVCQDAIASDRGSLVDLEAKPYDSLYVKFFSASASALAYWLTVLVFRFDKLLGTQYRDRLPAWRLSRFKNGNRAWSESNYCSFGIAVPFGPGHQSL